MAWSVTLSIISRLVLALLEGFLGRLPVGDIRERPLPVRDPPVVVADGRGLVANPDDVVVLRSIPVLPDESALVEACLVDLCEDVFAVIRMDPRDPQERLLEPASGLDPEHLLDLGADVGHRRGAAPIVGVDDEGTLLHQQAESGLRSHLRRDELGDDDVSCHSLIHPRTPLETRWSARAGTAYSVSRRRTTVFPLEAYFSEKRMETNQDEIA